jgi:hypothetical protein
VLALVTLALLPIGWDAAASRDEVNEAATGYDADGADTEAPCEHGAIAEPRSISGHRPPAPTVEIGAASRAPAPARPPAANRLARPYIPHPSRFTERRLI